MSKLVSDLQQIYPSPDDWVVVNTVNPPGTFVASVATVRGYTSTNRPNGSVLPGIVPPGTKILDLPVLNEVFLDDCVVVDTGLPPITCSVPLLWATGEVEADQDSNVELNTINSSRTISTLPLYEDIPTLLSGLDFVLVNRSVPIPLTGKATVIDVFGPYVPPVVADVLTLRSEFADMTYAAIYQADFPGVVEAEGTFTAATAGTNVTLSGGDMVATFSDTGSVANTTGLNKGPGPVAYEIEITSSVTGRLQVGMWATAFSTFDGNQPHGGGSDFGVWANMDGTVDGFVSGGPLGVTLVTGDVVGIVFGGSNVHVDFYVNGVARGGVNTLGDNDPLYAMGSLNT